MIESASITEQSQNGNEIAEPYQSSRQQLLAGLAVIDLHVRWAVTRVRAHGLNPDDAFRGLYISDNKVDQLLERPLGHNLWPRFDGADGDLAQWIEVVARARAEWQARTTASREAGIPMRLDALRVAFALAPLEIDVLLLALAPELDARYERLYAYLQDDVTKKRPSVELALSLLFSTFQERLDTRHYVTDASTLVSTGLLRRYADKNRSESALLGHFLRPAPTLVEHLLGRTILDPQLRPHARLWPADDLPPTADLSGALREQLQALTKERPFLAFRGGYGVGKCAAAGFLARQLEQPLLELDVGAAARDSDDLPALAQLLDRDGRLFNATLYLTGWDAILADNRPPDRFLRRLLAYPGAVIVAGEQEWQPRGARQRPILRVAFAGPDYYGRLQSWQRHITHHLDQDSIKLSAVANQFRFSPGQIRDAVLTARDLARWRGETATEDDVFAASRLHSNQNLATLATKIKPCYTWDDIVLPTDTFDQLQEMVNVVQQRHVVYEEWGFGRKMALGKGLSALFSGEPGTGKTMAADIMAGALGLDLYKVDLSTLVSKYIGETEKNLDRVFTEAATSNAILFFDEADAIFGKRSEVKDSHDRYANIEISFLLQRMEAYDGVVILATNLQANLDEAFTRRFHFITDFPFPEAADRERIWRVNIPPETPIHPDVDFGLLARRFRIAGGNIRNIILAAAFLAAKEDGVVTMSHLLHATRREFQKMGRLIEDALFNEI